MTLWDRAGARPASMPAHRPEQVALPAQVDLAALFTFMRDAERRFSTLRMRIEERTWGVRGEQVILHEVMLRHPGEARVTTSEPELGTRGNYEIWVSDGTTVRTYSAVHRIATNRPARRILAGLDNPDLPASARVYPPVTALPMETLPDLFVHPAGFLQNVVATGVPRIVTTAEHLGRETFVVECLHPRVTEVSTDRPDHALELTVDRETGVILRLVETVADEVTRDALVRAFEPDAPLPPTAFDFVVPPGATNLF